MALLLMLVLFLLARLDRKAPSETRVASARKVFKALRDLLGAKAPSVFKAPTARLGQPEQMVPLALKVMQARTAASQRLLKTATYMLDATERGC